jgi:hypothetical protein
MSMWFGIVTSELCTTGLQVMPNNHCQVYFTDKFHIKNYCRFAEICMTKLPDVFFKVYMNLDKFWNKYFVYYHK